MRQYTLAALAILAISPGVASAECAGAYGEDLTALSAHARDVEAHTLPSSYAVRTTATYECAGYGRDGNLKATHISTLAYGTAFGYRRDGADTLLLTNQHVAEWPAITDDEHAVDGVPVGCKRVADSLSIVDDSHDNYAADDILLERVVVDPALDVAVLRAHAKLAVLPWRVGTSASLTPRDFVQVQGFPLGELAATNVGHVVSTSQHDHQADWNHEDFIVDALLASGGSGSPVLAVSCKTGEFELVGIFHARYSAASALNVVIAIDQAHELMTKLVASPRPAPPLELDGAARIRLAEAVRHDPDPPFFAVGNLVASVRIRADDSLVFTLYPGDFPKTTRPLLAIEDLPADDAKQFGKLGASYVGRPAGLQQLTGSELVLARTLAVLRTDAVAAYELREAGRASVDSRAAFDKRATQERAFAHLLETQRETAQAVVELADHAQPAGKTFAVIDQ
jgi:serine protease Do